MDFDMFYVSNIIKFNIFISYKIKRNIFQNFPLIPSSTVSEKFKP